MTRILLNVEPAGDAGWDVNLRRHLLDHQPSPDDAIRAASEHAYRRYVVTGTPTCVALALGDGDSVIVQANG
jgi:hypothetical protein